jgi:NTP pyrophosphatase (non-canonical NTP hydrolase)
MSEIVDVRGWPARVRDWAIARNLVEGSSPIRQLLKLDEEVTELEAAIANSDRSEIIDAIGDIQVVLAVMCAQLDLDIDQCREAAWEQIKDRTGRMVEGVFVKDA